jgi:hypothetical protein
MFVEIVAAQSSIKSSLGNLIFHQFDKQVYAFPFNFGNGVLSPYNFIDIAEEILKIQLQFEVPDKLYDISLISSDEVEVFLVVGAELSDLLLEEWVAG